MASFPAMKIPEEKGDYVYLVKCQDGTLYTGYTTNLKRRIREHNSGQGALYTRGRAPVELVYYQDCGDRSQALQEEYRIKQLSRADKVKLIQQG